MVILIRAISAELWSHDHTFLGTLVWKWTVRRGHNHQMRDINQRMKLINPSKLVLHWGKVKNNRQGKAKTWELIDRDSIQGQGNHKCTNWVSSHRKPSSFRLSRPSTALLPSPASSPHPFEASVQAFLLLLPSAACHSSPRYLSSPFLPSMLCSQITFSRSLLDQLI